MTTSIVSHADFVINLFCIVDDLKRMVDRHLIGKKDGRKTVLTDSECITVAILRWKVGSTSWKAFYREVLPFYRPYFPHLPEYANFIEHIHRVTPLINRILPLLLQFARSEGEHHIYFIDSTPLPVCNVKRINSHKVAKDFASRKKSTMGWFYGFKLHAICDTEGRLVSIQLTTGSLDDRAPVLNLIKGLSGILIADAGYLGEELQAKLREAGIHFQTASRKNMNKLMTRLQHFLFNQRQVIERVFASLKYRFGLDLSLSRSINGMFATILTALAFYQIKTAVLAVS